MKENAGFWLRFVAFIIDAIVISMIRGFIVVPILGIFGLSIASGGMDMFNHLEDTSDIIALVTSIIAFAGVLALISTIIWVLYYSLMESSKYQATLGKLALGLIVTDMNGNKIDFGKALLRNICKFISSMVFFIGYIMAGFTEKKQALHDIIASTLVTKK